MVSRRLLIKPILIKQPPFGKIIFDLKRLVDTPFFWDIMIFRVPG